MYIILMLLGLKCLFCDANDIDGARACQREPGHVIRYYKGTKKCYRVHSQGPCEDPSFTFVLDDDYFGSCKCKEAGRRTAYYPPDNKCYSVYDTAFCPKGKALLPLSLNSSTLSCQADPCYKSRQENPQLITMFKGTCVTIGANCNPKWKEWEIRFDPDGTTVNCGLPLGRRVSLGFSALARSCPRGQFRSANGYDCLSTVFTVDNW